MFEALAAADGASWLSIVAKTGAYATTLLSIGGVLLCLVLRTLTPADHRLLRAQTLVAGFAAAVFSALEIIGRSLFLVGGAWAEAVNPQMLVMVADGPLGTSIAIRLLGLGILVIGAALGRWPPTLAIPGILLAAVSFSLRGHATEAYWLGIVLTIHLLGLAYWIAAFYPLFRIAGSRSPASTGAVAREFGAVAAWVVATVAVVGATMLVRLGGAGPEGLVPTSAYGQGFAVKLLLFLALVCIAALNRTWLTPALLQSRPVAASRLRMTIVAESLIVAGVLLSTAIVTTLTSPPTL